MTDKGLVAGLKERVTHRYLAKTVLASKKKAKKLPKPLEKIEEQKVCIFCVCYASILVLRFHNICSVGLST